MEKLNHRKFSEINEKYCFPETLKYAIPEKSTNMH